MLWLTLRQLGSNDWGKRDRAKEKLAQSRDPRAVVPSIGMLNHKNGSVRLNVADLLRDIGDARAVEPLAMALGD